MNSEKPTPVSSTSPLLRVNKKTSQSGSMLRQCAVFKQKPPANHLCHRKSPMDWRKSRCLSQQSRQARPNNQPGVFSNPQLQFPRAWSSRKSLTWSRYCGDFHEFFQPTSIASLVKENLLRPFSKKKLSFQWTNHTFGREIFQPSRSSV